MRKRRWIVGLAGVLLALGTAGPAQALGVTVTPGSVSPTQGSPFVLTLGINGLTAAGAPSLRDFTIKLGFDPLLLSVLNVDFELALGFPCAPGDPDLACEAVRSSSVASAGPLSILTLSETSLLDPTEPELANQLASFALATITFTPLAVGSTSIDVVTDAFTQLVVTDLGTPENISLAPFDLPLASTQVETQPVPEPGTALLLALGLLGTALRRPRAG